MFGFIKNAMHYNRVTNQFAKVFGKINKNISYEGKVIGNVLKTSCRKGKFYAKIELNENGLNLINNVMMYGVKNGVSSEGGKKYDCS